MDQHQILTDLEDHGYKRIDERSNMWKLLNGIKTDALDVIKAQIITSEHLCSSFTVYIDLYQDFIK